MAVNYPAVDALADMDTMARMLELLETACGGETTDDTLAHGAMNMQNRIGAAYSSTDQVSIVNNFAQPIANLRTGLATASLAAYLLRPLLTGLKTELGNDIGAWLDDEDYRCDEKFGDLYFAAFATRLAPLSVVFPRVVTMGGMVRGASTWTFTDVAAVDLTKTGGAQLEAVVNDGTIGGVNCVLTIAGLDAAGTVLSKTVTVTAGATVGTAFAVGSATDLFADVTGCTATGGTSGDTIILRTKLLRSVAAACS